MVRGCVLVRPPPRLDSSWLGVSARNVWKKAGLTPISLQESRHTAATWLDAAGVPPKIASVLMGHATPARQPGAAQITLARCRACAARGHGRRAEEARRSISLTTRRPRPASDDGHSPFSFPRSVAPGSSGAVGGIPAVNGHRFLPTGGHLIPHWWPSFLPAGGHRMSPPVAIVSPQRGVGFGVR